MRNQRPAQKPFLLSRRPAVAAGAGPGAWWQPHKGSRLPDTPRSAHSWPSGSSEPAMSCSSVITSHQLEKLQRAGPWSQLHASCPEAALSGADVVAPGAWSGPKVDKKEGRKEEGERPGRGTLHPLVRPFKEGLDTCCENSPFS